MTLILSERQAQKMGLDAPAKTNKYRVSAAAARTINGIRFDSAAEARRWGELKLLERAGEIARLSRQPEYVLIEALLDSDGKKQRAIKYIADFRYLLNGRIVVEDVKGFSTAAYKIKKRLFLQRYPEIIFREIRK